MSVPIVKIPISTSGCDAFIKQGDTIPKIRLTFSDYTGDLTTATIKVQLYHNSRKVLDISNGSGITVISSTVLEIDEISADNNNLPPGISEGDFEVTESDGSKTTYFNIELTIQKQYTK